ncbi:MAG: hypothetical protein NVSMB46_01440 [Candidatus Saccharimonadales bacterium]
MLILGMTGPIGHGKTTFAAALAEIVPRTVHFESSLIIAEIANAMHDCLKEPFDPYDVAALNNWLKNLPSIIQNNLHVACSYSQIELKANDIENHPIEFQKLILHAENLRRNFTIAKSHITTDNKEIYRPFLQWLGGYLVKTVDKGIWWNEIIKRIKDAERNQYDLCIAGGLRFPTDAVILRSIGGVIIKVYRPGHLQNDMLDPTERERESIIVDSQIISDGTMDQLHTCAKIFFQDCRDSTLKDRYQTSLM